MPRIRVAIADDHAVVCEGYRRLLELEHDMDVVATFSTGEAAYRWLSTHAADVLILDISMPGRGGLDTLKRLHYRLPALKIMIFTMHESESLASHALALGAQRFITKTSSPHVLIEAVREIAAPHERTRSDSAPAHDADLSPHERLSPREFDVFLLLAQGVSVDEIASSRMLSKKTVANYQTVIRQKTGCRSPVEILRYAQRLGLTSDLPNLERSMSAAATTTTADAITQSRKGA